jgi:hypothetical protein
VNAVDNVVESSALQRAIESFSQRANANEHVRRLTRDWQTPIFVQATDEGGCYRLLRTDGLITGVEPAELPQHETLLLRGRGLLLEDLFSGRTHPLNAYNDGDLEIYGSQQDQIKLDSISLLIWGA